MKGKISLEIPGIKGIRKEYYEEFHANKFNNLDEMHKFLERHKLPKKKQENLN